MAADKQGWSGLGRADQQVRLAEYYGLLQIALILKGGPQGMLTVCRAGVFCLRWRVS